MWTTAYCCSSGREGGTDTPAGHGSLQTHTVTLAHTHTYTRSSVIILSSISTHSEAGGRTRRSRVCSGDGEFEHFLFF